MKYMKMKENNWNNNIIMKMKMKKKYNNMKWNKMIMKIMIK